jgi:CubicO group peptidase (beta-lactamase class C family)
MGSPVRFDSDEIAPESVDMDAQALERVVALVQEHNGRAPAHLHVLRHGRTVLNRRFNCAAGSLFVVFSAGKPLTAMLVHLLAERGLLDLDRPVAEHWPEYGELHGKGAITVRHVLQHRAGVPVSGRSALAEALAMADWDRAVRDAQEARPQWEPGAAAGYHTLSFGFILGELVRRVTGDSVPVFLNRELLAPLGMRETFLGLPAQHWRRRVPLHADGWADVPRRYAFNRRSVRTGVIPAANVSSTATDLARFYQALLDGGELDGVRVLRPDTVAAARTPSNAFEGEVDLILDRPVRWSQGFQLGAAPYPPPRRQPMGTRSGRDSFGHNGSNTCNAWADPRRGLVFAYASSRLVPRQQGAVHQAAVSDAVLDACR